VYPGDQVADDLLADFVGHVVLVVGWGITLGLQELPRALGPFDVVPQAVSDEDGLVSLGWQLEPHLIRISDGTTESHKACEEVGAAQPTAIGHAASLGKSQKERVTLGHAKCLHDLLEEAVQFPLGVEELIGVVASGFCPGETDHAGLQLDGNWGVGARVHIASGVYRPSEVGEVVHVGAEPVQEDDEGVGEVGIVFLGVYGKIGEVLALDGLHLHCQCRVFHDTPSAFEPEDVSAQVLRMASLGEYPVLLFGDAQGAVLAVAG